MKTKMILRGCGGTLVASLVAMSAILSSCSSQTREEINGPAVDCRVEVQGNNFDADLRATSIGRLRVISSVGNYNQLTQLKGGAETFTLPNRQRQTLLFVAGEKSNLSSLTAAAFNAHTLNTADYFGNKGSEPRLFVGSTVLERRLDTAPLSLPIEFSPVYAKCCYSVSLSKPTGTFDIESVKVCNIPTTFSLGGVQTAYKGPYTSFDFGKKQDATFFLPEHDPEDVNNRTYLRVLIKTKPGSESKSKLPPEGKEFFVVLKDPYTSVYDGKIVRAHHYKMNVTINTKPFEK